MSWTASLQLRKSCMHFKHIPWPLFNRWNFVACIKCTNPLCNFANIICCFPTTCFKSTNKCYISILFSSTTKTSLKMTSQIDSPPSYLMDSIMNLKVKTTNAILSSLIDSNVNLKWKQRKNKELGHALWLATLLG
jgi:hypothetical protein